MVRLKQTRGLKLIVGVVFLGTLLGSAGCGHSVGPSTNDSSNSTTSAQDAIPVSGVGGFGSQCPFGVQGDPVPLQLTESGCPLAASPSSSDDSSSTKKKFQLTQPLLPIILQADCKKMEVTARTIDGYRIEDRWNALPDGRFYFVMDAGNASLGANGGGASGCQTTATLEVNGLMKCKDRDHVEVEVDATWHLGQTMPGTTPHLTSGACSANLKGCDLHGFTTLNQCGG